MATALVTGGSRGIGLELARLLARDRHDLILVSRTAPRLDQVAQDLRAEHGVSVTAIPADLSLPGAGVALWAEVEQRGLAVDLLVNNAGVGLVGPVAEAAPERLAALVRLNVEALVTLTRLALPGMIERRRGRIANLASTAAFQPGPHMAAYYASKAFVLSFSEAVAHELRGTGVTVTAVCPGPTPTGFQRETGLGGRKRPGITVMPVDRVAAAAYRGVMRGRRVVVPGLANRLLALGARLAPRQLAMIVVGRINRYR